MFKFVGLTQRFLGLTCEFVGLISKFVGLTRGFVGLILPPKMTVTSQAWLSQSPIYVALRERVRRDRRVS